jgi:hypothetical protein
VSSPATAGEHGRRIVEKAIAAAGGHALWRSIQTLELRVRLGGTVPAGKGLALPPDGSRATLDRTSGQLRLELPARPSFVGVAAPDGAVWVEDATGAVLERRADGRAAFPAQCWDDLHYSYFAGYALRTYLSTPFLLAEPGFSVRALRPARVFGRRSDRLAVVFPDSFVTHSRRQVFYFDHEGLLVRHDYTAEPITRRVGVAHLSADHRTFDGLRLPTRRWVVPRLLGHPLPGPRLITLDLDQVRIARSE